MRRNQAVGVGLAIGVLVAVALVLVSGCAVVQAVGTGAGLEVPE